MTTGAAQKIFYFANSREVKSQQKAMLFESKTKGKMQRVRQASISGSSQWTIEGGLKIKNFF